MKLLAARIGSTVHYYQPYSPVQKTKIERWFLRCTFHSDRLTSSPVTLQNNISAGGHLAALNGNLARCPFAIGCLATLPLVRCTRTGVRLKIMTTSKTAMSLS